jgi:hypothetical protein
VEATDGQSGRSSKELPSWLVWVWPCPRVLAALTAVSTAAAVAAGTAVAAAVPAPPVPSSWPAVLLSAAAVVGTFACDGAGGATLVCGGVREGVAVAEGQEGERVSHDRSPSPFAVACLGVPVCVCVCVCVCACESTDARLHCLC